MSCLTVLLYLFLICFGIWFIQMENLDVHDQSLMFMGGFVSELWLTN